MVYQQGGVGIVQHSLSIESGRDCSTWPSYRVSYGLFIMVSLQGGQRLVSIVFLQGGVGTVQQGRITGCGRDCLA